LKAVFINLQKILLKYENDDKVYADNLLNITDQATVMKNRYLQFVTKFTKMPSRQPVVLSLYGGKSKLFSEKCGQNVNYCENCKMIQHFLIEFNPLYLLTSVIG